MAYKFQVGPAQLSGALTQEGTLTAEGLASLDGGINVNSSNFTVSTAGAVVAESTVSGAAATFDSIAGTSLALQDGGITNAGNISGSALTMDALAGTSLALQSGGITAAGAIAGASTISGSDTLSISHVDIDGALTVGAANAFSVSAVGNLIACPSASIADLYISDDAHFADTVLVEGLFTASAGLLVKGGDFGLVVGASGEFMVDSSNGAISTSGDVSGSAFFINAGSDAQIAENWLPDVDNTLNLGSANKRWSKIYVDSIVGADLALDVFTGTSYAAGTDVLLANGNATLLDIAGNGQTIRVKNISGGLITVDCDGSDTFFDTGTTQIELETDGAAVTLISSGSSWYII